jgi:hypothetical protein
MEMSDRLTKVIGNYEVKLRLGANGRLSEGEIRQRVVRYGIAAAQEDGVLSQVRQVLCSAGVVTMMFPYYHAFSRELGKITRQESSAERIQEEFAVTVAKWTARGLLQAVLRDIGATVFNLSMPTPPDNK